MIPVLEPGQLGQEIRDCMALGAVCGGARALFPVRGRAAFMPDLLWVGSVLLALQSYAAGNSSAGVLRWYMLAAAFATAALSARVLGVPLRALGRSVVWGVALPVRFLRRRAAARRTKRRLRRKTHHSAKRNEEKSKKCLPNQRLVLYNSNVSK